MAKEDRKFVIGGEGQFWAKDLRDAFLKLSEHFKALAVGDDSDLFDAPTDIFVEKLINSDE